MSKWKGPIKVSGDEWYYKQYKLIHYHGLRQWALHFKIDAPSKDNELGTCAYYFTPTEAQLWADQIIQEREGVKTMSEPHNGMIVLEGGRPGYICYNGKNFAIIYLDHGVWNFLQGYKADCTPVKDSTIKIKVKDGYVRGADIEED